MTFTFGELIPEMSSDPKIELSAFQRKAWGDFDQTHLYTVPIHKEHWEWIHNDRFWRPEISSDITAWIRDYEVHAKLGSVQVERPRRDPRTKDMIMKKMNDPAIHFLDVRKARYCHLHWGGCGSQVRKTHIVTVGTLPAPGKLLLHKDQLKELKRLKKLIEQYGYHLPA